MLRESHTTPENKAYIVNLLDLIFNKDREKEREQHRLNRQMDDDKKKKLSDMKDEELKKINESRLELESFGKDLNKDETSQKESKDGKGDKDNKDVKGNKDVKNNKDNKDNK